MRKTVLALPALTVVVLAGCASAGGNGTSATTPASPSATATDGPTASPSDATSSPAVRPTGQFDASNTAGWAARSPAHRLVRVTGTISLTAASLATHGRLGIQLCDSKTGYAVQFGAVPAGSGWEIAYYAGTLSATTGIDGNPCEGNQMLAATSNLTRVGQVPAGAQIKAQIAEQGNGQVTLTYAYSTSASFSSHVHAASSTFNEVAAIASYAAVSFRGALASDVAAFSNVTATSATGQTGGLAAWKPVKVASKSTKTGKLTVSPSDLQPASGTGPSSFTIIDATPSL